MKGKRVLLHAGFAKTGTTAIQTALASARQELSQRGIVYPKCQLSGLPRRESHPAVSFAHLRNRFSSYRRVVDRREAQAWLVGVLGDFTASPDHLLILSHETLGEAARRIRWRGLRTELRPFEVSSLLYVRVLDDFLESRLEQSLRSGFHSARALRHQAAHLRLSNYSYVARLARLERGLRSPVQVLSFDAVRKADTLLDSFIAASGIPGGIVQRESGTGSARRNVSIVPAHRLFLLHASNPKLPPAVRSELIHVFRSSPPGLPGELVGRRYGLLQPALKDRARRLFNREVPQLNLRYGCTIEPARDLEPADLDYATRLAPAEYALIADTLADRIPADSLALVRQAFER